TAAPVDHDLKKLLIKAIGAGVHRQQQMLEGDSGIVCGDVVNPLFITADVTRNVSSNYACTKLPHTLETFCEVHLIMLGLKPGQERRIIWLQLHQVPRLQRLETILRHRDGSWDEYVVEPAGHCAGSRRPAGVSHLSGACDLVPFTVRLVISFRCVVMIAAFTAVKTGGIRVVGPERKIHAA